MWLVILLAFIPNSVSDDSAYYLQNSSYLQFIGFFSDKAVIPCTLKTLTQTKVRRPTIFSMTPFICLLLISTLAYSRHRTRMIAAEKSRYNRACFVNQWFENQRNEEGERGVHEIDVTIRSNEFCYDDVKVTNEAFQMLCKESGVSSIDLYSGWSSVIYTSRVIHTLVAVISLLLCFIASFVLVGRTVHFEVEIGSVRSHIDHLVEELRSAGIEGKTFPTAEIDPELCISEDLFFPAQLEEREVELIASAVAVYLSGTNDAVTRVSSMLLVLTAFFTLFHLWLTAFKTATLTRKSSLVAPQHQVCLLASERHAQLASFVLSIIIIACVVIEDNVYQNNTNHERHRIF